MAASTKESVEASERMIAEVRETRDLESAPYVIPFIDINHHIMYFGIKNIGKTVAENVKFEINPELKQYIGGDIKEIPLIKNGLSSLPPGHEIGTKFAISHKYLNQLDTPKKYLVKITFFGGLSKKRREYDQILDLSIYHDLIPDEDMRLSDIVKELENLSKNSNKISDNLVKFNESFEDGVWIKNPELLTCNIKYDLKFSKSMTLSKLRELREIISSMLEDSVDFPCKNSQLRMNSLAMQLLVISSYNDYIYSDYKINEKFRQLARNTMRFAESMHFVCGCKLEGFAEEVKELNAAIDNLIKSIEACNGIMDCCGQVQSPS
jgi:hypothetical protein